MAGYSPNEIPIIAENDTEINIHSKEMTAGHSGTDKLLRKFQSF